MKRIVLLTENTRLRDFLKPLAQWLDFHAPERPIEALESIQTIQPDCLLVDATVVTPMVQALLNTIQSVAPLSEIPVVMLGESQASRRLKVDGQLPGKFNLRRLEEKIAEVLKIRLVGRGSHGPHHGSIY